MNAERRGRNWIRSACAAKPRDAGRAPHRPLSLLIACMLGVPLQAIAGNTFIVDTTQDPGPGGTQSLRQAVTLANASAGNTIQFAPALVGSTITLAGGEIDISKAMTIDGPGSGMLTISGNHASRLFLAAYTGGTVAFKGVTLADGYTSGGLAGAAIAAVGAAVSLDDCIVRDNQSRNGAGIFAYNSSVSISHSRITGNASIYEGGGLVAKCSSPACTNALVVTQSTISGNSAGQFGGGIYAYLMDSVTIDRSVISGNRATAPTGQAGGGVFLYAVQTPLITNSTISGNYAYSRGGGIYADFASIVFTTIAGNSTHASASNGILARAGGQIELDDSILANNFSNAGAVDVSGALTANASLIRNAGTATIGGSASLIGVDPQLGPLADHGGATWSMLPAAGSPAVNAAEDPPPIAFDQRGLPRPAGAKSDMGAVERQAIEDVIFRDGFNFS